MTTSIYPLSDDLGKKVYRKKTIYSIVVEQDVLADNEDEADNLLRDGGGIDHSCINDAITVQEKGVETQYVDATYQESDMIEEIGNVIKDEDGEITIE